MSSSMMCGGPLEKGTVIPILCQLRGFTIPDSPTLYDLDRLKHHSFHRRWLLRTNPVQQINRAKFH